MPSNSAVIGAIVGVIAAFTLLLVLLVSIYYCCCCVVYVDNRSYRARDLSYSLDVQRHQRFRRIARWVFHPDPQLTRKDLEMQQQQGKDSTVLAGDEKVSNAARCHEAGTTPSSDEAPATPSHEVSAAVTSDNTKRDKSGKRRSFRSKALSYGVLADGIGRETTHMGNKAALVKRLSSIRSIEHATADGRKTSLGTTIFEPSEGEQAYLTDQFDSFSRTLVLQNMLQNSINYKADTIKSVRDNFSNSLIAVGVVVVVVKQFHGTESYEFSCLQAGDLLRVVKFYYKTPDRTPTNATKTMHLLKNRAMDKEVDVTDTMTVDNDDVKSTEEDDATIKQRLSTTSEQDTSQVENASEIFVDKDDPNYRNIYCTGVILNTYLEYDSYTSNLGLRFKESASRGSDDESELLKDFPLSIVSLETTVLRTMVDSPLEQNTFEKHFV